MNYHQYDVGLPAFAILRSGQILQCLFTVPGGRYVEAQLLDGLDGNLLVDRVIFDYKNVNLGTLGSCEVLLRRGLLE